MELQIVKDLDLLFTMVKLDLINFLLPKPQQQQEHLVEMEV